MRPTMRSREPHGRSPFSQSRAVRFDLAFRAALVAGLWLVLHLLGGELTSLVVVAILAAIFGPEALRAGRNWLSGDTDAK